MGSNASLVSAMGYKPWGETRYGVTLTSFQYTGQRNAPEIGLYFYNARWYDPYLNRWTQPDTIVPEASQGTQAWDRYAYVNNNPVKYNDPTGHDVGCGGSDASECGSKTTVVIACGRDGDVCGYNSETMKPYYDYAVENGYQVYYYDPDNKKYDPSQQKYDMATDMAGRINDYPDNDYYLFGHSAGADATILATEMTGYSDNIQGVALLDPTMEATIPGQAGVSIQGQADQIASNGIPVFLGDTPNDSNIDASIAGATEMSYNYSHKDLATANDVFRAAIAAIMR